MQISRHINHTGRKKIKHTEVEIRMVEQGGKPPAFETEFRLNKDKLPADADLFVEAYHRNTSQRFPFGTVAAPIQPDDTTLDQIDLSGPTLFRVKIVDNTQSIGRLIATADRLTPEDDEDEEQRTSLMIIKSMPMGNVTWNIAFNEAHKPVLCINNKIPDAKNQLLYNPFFQSLVLPAAFREVLMFILWNQEDEQTEGSWQHDWMEFSNRLGPEECPAESDPDILHGWIDDVIRTFSEKHHFCDHLIRRIEEQHYD